LNQVVKTGRGVCSFKCTNTNAKLTLPQRTMTLLNETNKTVVTNTKEFKIMILKKLNELHKNTDRKLNKIKTIILGDN
jgi:hypothetical protein